MSGGKLGRWGDGRVMPSRLEEATRVGDGVIVARGARDGGRVAHARAQRHPEAGWTPQEGAAPALVAAAGAVEGEA